MLAAAREPVEPDKQAVLFYIYCDDVAGFRAQLVQAGVEAGPIQSPFYAHAVSSAWSIPTDTS